MTRMKQFSCHSWLLFPLTLPLELPKIQKDSKCVGIGIGIGIAIGLIRMHKAIAIETAIAITIRIPTAGDYKARKTPRTSKMLTRKEFVPFVAAFDSRPYLA